MIIFNCEKNHLLKFLSSLIVKSDVQAENFYFQVNFINCYPREIISFAKKLTLETGASKSKQCPHKSYKNKEKKVTLSPWAYNFITNIRRLYPLCQQPFGPRHETTCLRSNQLRSQGPELQCLLKVKQYLR